VENPRPDILKPVTFSRAIVRIPGQSFTNGLTASAALGSPEIGLALAQHAAYCEALRRCGLEVTVLPPDERFPDGTFVEDTAVVAQRVAVATRPGAPTRTGRWGGQISVWHSRSTRPIAKHCAAADSK